MRSSPRFGCLALLKRLLVLLFLAWKLHWQASSWHLVNHSHLRICGDAQAIKIQFNLVFPNLLMDFMMIKKLKANNKLDFWLATSDLFWMEHPVLVGKSYLDIFRSLFFNIGDTIAGFQTESCMISDKVLDNWKMRVGIGSRREKSGLNTPMENNGKSLRNPRGGHITKVARKSTSCKVICTD